MKTLYICLLVLRILLTLQPGYIHPDEFFQSGQEIFFGLRKEVAPEQRQPTKHISLRNGYETVIGGVVIDEITATWEFEKEHALRSILPPTIMTILPLKFYSKFRRECKGLSLHQCVAGWEILVIPRVFMAILSMILIDGPIWYIAKSRRACNSKVRSLEGIPIEAIVIASSWVTLGFLNRPFSNSLETMCLAVLCMLVAIDIQSSGKKSIVPVAMGFVGSIGLFTRFTFAIFALPTVIAMLYGRLTTKLNASLLEKTKIILTTLLLIAIPFVAISCIFIQHDTAFYSSQSGSDDNSISFISAIRVGNIAKYITPWNAFRYNSRVENLSDHGLHPRVTHAFVNLPMLYGPLAIAFYVSIMMRGGGKNRDTKMNVIDGMLNGILVLGLGVLSSAPHQEPRFLLPLSIPLVLMHGGVMKKHPRFGHSVASFWIIFNILLLTFFGFVHQGAVLPSLMALPRIVANGVGLPKAIIYYHTYMPPTFLLRNGVTKEINKHESSQEPDNCTNNYAGLSLCQHVPIIDLQGSDEAELMSSMLPYLSCSSSDLGVVFMVSPRSIMEQICNNHSQLFKCTEIWNSFQIATEDLPTDVTLKSFVKDSKMGMYEIKC